MCLADGDNDLQSALSEMFGLHKIWFIQHCSEASTLVQDSKTRNGTQQKFEASARSHGLPLELLHGILRQRHRISPQQSRGRNPPRKDCPLNDTSSTGKRCSRTAHCTQRRSHKPSLWMRKPSICAHCDVLRRRYHETNNTRSSSTRGDSFRIYLLVVPYLQGSQTRHGVITAAGSWTASASIVECEVSPGVVKIPSWKLHFSYDFEVRDSSMGLVQRLMEDQEHLTYLWIPRLAVQANQNSSGASSSRQQKKCQVAENRNLSLKSQKLSRASWTNSRTSCKGH